MREPTNFIESNALLAVQAKDDGHALELLDTMFPNELWELALAAERLGRLCRLKRQQMVYVPMEERA